MTFIHLFSFKVVNDSLTVNVCVCVSEFTSCKAHGLSVIALAPTDKSPHMLLLVPKNCDFESPVSFK